MTGEQRFCSRCGFPLSGVAQLLSTGGNLPAVQNLPSSQGLSPRQQGVRQGAMLMLMTILLVPLVAILTAGIIGHFQFLIPVTAICCFMGGLIRILYAVLLESNHPVTKSVETPAIPPYIPPAPLKAGLYSEALPPGQQAPPIQSWKRPRNTAELVEPPSVTESTTRLLNSDQDPKG